ncbi:MAG: UvrD-helicase domain-containing protein [Victivallaceae bacterium]|nr:UvrD-helicase domain-containing protein [Victivallaceae bacterium]
MTDAELAKLLNPQQAEAVKTITGPVLVLAGAGTGKTRVITFRIAYLLDQGINPENILAMTFTNKAAREMKERLGALVDPEQVKKLTLGTFHSFCVKVLRREIGKLHYLPNFGIVDESDRNGLIRQAAAALGFPKNEAPVNQAKDYISRMKNRLCFPRQAKKLADGGESPEQVRFSRVYEEYQNLLEAQNVVDFDDMLLLVHGIFAEFPEVLDKYRQRYRYLLVDEYQDTNDAQLAVIRQLTAEHRNLCVVGDDDQSIYGWRGANVSNILDFSADFPEAKSIKLEQNYRSTAKILAAANAVIGSSGRRYAKQLWSARGTGENLLLVKAADAEREAEFVADYIAGKIADDPACSYNDFAVLYRSNHLSRSLEMAFRRAAIPYRMVGGQEFFDRKEIKDAVAYLKVLVNPPDDQSLLRVLNLPPRGLGGRTVDILKRHRATGFRPFFALLTDEACRREFSPAAAAATAAFGAVFERYREVFAGPGGLAVKVGSFLTDVGYLDGLQKIYKDRAESQKRRENVGEFISAVAAFEKNSATAVKLQDYLESYALLEENDKIAENNSDGRGVTLTTVHAAKGLEYPYVFQVAMEKNVFPHQRAVSENSTDEELRLFYVALTRAGKQLIITYSASRPDKGVERNQFPSEFLRYLPEDLVDVRTPEELIKPLPREEVSKRLAAIRAMLDN